MKPYIARAKGNVLVLGLGMGYVPYMISLKEEVSSVTIIEKDKEIIELFKKALLPLFPNKHKIKIIEDDAIRYLNKKEATYDYIFADLWHNSEDGLSLFVQLKRINQNIDCWLEVSLYQMLRRCMITLLEEQLDNMSEENYKYSRNYTDKIVNKYYQRTKNLHLDSEDKLNDLLSDESLLKLAL
jgi:16S rRNA G966 N2-methylase RsmD